MSGNSYESKQEFMIMISHSLEVLEDGLVSETNRQSIRHGILETISNLLDLRDRVNKAVVSVPILNAWGRDIGSATEDLASRYSLAISEIDFLREALERFAKIDLTGPIGNAIAWDILNARAALNHGKDELEEGGEK